MSSEQNLTVANGNPVAGFSQGRNGGTPDLDADTELYYGRGLSLVVGSAERNVYTTVFGQLVLNGTHPKVAMKTVLLSLGIDYQEDQFLVTENGVSREI